MKSQGHRLRYVMEKWRGQKFKNDARAATLCTRREVEEARRRALGIFADEVLRVPDKISWAIAKESDVAKVCSMLAVAVRDALTTAADRTRSKAGSS